MADVQLHILRDAAERTAQGHGGSGASDRLQDEARHTSHGERRYW